MNGGLWVGLALPDVVLQAPTVRVLTAFVAVNSVMYGALAFAKMLPKVHPSDLARRGREDRSEDRSIYPPGHRAVVGRTDVDTTAVEPTAVDPTAVNPAAVERSAA